MEKEYRITVVEQEVAENASITEEILRRRGVESIAELPFEVGKELIAVDSVQASLHTKIKLLGYRFWYQDGRFDLIKEYFPEGTFRLEDLEEVMNNQNGLGHLYQEVAGVADIADEVISVDSEDIARYRIVFDQIKRFFSVYQNEEFILAQRERIIKSKNKRLESEDDKRDLPIRLAVEWLRSKKLYQKEIAGILGVSERRIEFILRGLYLEGRADPQPEHAERTKRFIELALEVEKLRKRRLTIKQIANITNANEKQVQDAVRVLISLGRADAISPEESLQRRYRTTENKRKVRTTLKKFLKQHPGEQISYIELRQLSGVNISLQRLGEWYREISAQEEVPPVKEDARERATEILLEIGRNTREQVNLLELSRQRKLSYKTFLRAYDDIRHNPDAPVLKIAESERKKRDFIDALTEFLITNPGEQFSIRSYCKTVGLNYTTGVRWYREMSSSEELPPIRAVWKKPKQSI